MKKTHETRFPPKFRGLNGRALRCRVNDNSSFRDNTIKGFYVTNVKADRRKSRENYKRSCFCPIPNKRGIIHFDTGRFCA